MKQVIEQLTIGIMHVTIYKRDADGESFYSASFEPDPNTCVHSCYESDHLNDLALAAQTADLIIRCHEQRLSVMKTSDRLLRLGVLCKPNSQCLIQDLE